MQTIYLQNTDSILSEIIYKMNITGVPKTGPTTKVPFNFALFTYKFLAKLLEFAKSYNNIKENKYCLNAKIIV